MAISGKNGSVIFNSVSACVTEWNVSNNIERLDATNTCSGGKREYVAGINEWTGSFTSHTYVIAASTVAVTLSNDDITISGTALADFSVSSPVQGSVVEYTYDLAFTGTVTVS